jgi:DNA-binding NarL/FixJ family response regulator
MKTQTVIIDDHTLFNDGLSLILKESGHFKVIEQIYDSRQAYFKCFKLMPQLIIIDYNMPYLNGLEVVKQLKTLTSDAKIVIVSMYAEKREIALFEEVGVDAYITKTTPSNELIAILKKVMQGEKIFESSFNNKPIIEKDTFALKNNLTKREIEVLKLIKKNYTTEEIATALNVSFYTVETHRKNVNQKMKFKTKNEFYEFLAFID